MIRTLIVVIMVLLCTSNYGQSKQVLKVDAILAKGDTAKAMKKLNGYITKEPESADLYLKRAKLKLSRKEYEPAMVDLNTFCSLNKVCGEAAFLKGVVRFKQNDFNGAIALFSDYTALQDDAQAWFYLALSHMWLQNYPVAVNAFDRSLKISPEQPQALYNAGISSFRMENYALADSFLLAALSLDPNDTDIKIARGLTLLRSGNHIESNKVFRTIEESDEKHGIAQYNIGVNYYHMDEYELACDYWERAIALGHLQAQEAKDRHCGERLRRSRSK